MSNPAQPSPQPDGTFDPGPAFWGSATVSARIALTVAAAAACIIFDVAARQFGLPVLPGFDGSVLAQPSPIVDLFIILVALAVATLVGTIIARAVHFEAGLFAAAFGLMLLSLRCGTMQSVLFEANGSQNVYWRLILETIILGAFLVGLWFLLCKFSGPVRIPADNSNLSSSFTATVAQVVATGIIMMFLCQSEAKNQCLASIGIASWIGAMVAYKYSPTHPSIWYWIGPLLVGIIGFALAALGQDTNLEIGAPTGAFAALARPLPLDYASVGVAGAILGYWMMLNKQSD
jgi:hypothetical protein